MTEKKENQETRSRKVQYKLRRTEVEEQEKFNELRTHLRAGDIEVQA